MMALLLALLQPLQLALPPNVVPLPASYEPSDGNVELAPGFRFAAAPSSHTSATLTDALARFTALSDGGGTAAGAAAEQLEACMVHVSDASLVLNLDTDESYRVTILSSQPNASCTIEAPTAFGAMHAMETVVQLINRADRSIAAARVVDKPRWPFRATMIDTSRHWYPVDAILRHIDAMACVKMNVLHWVRTEAAFLTPTLSTTTLAKGLGTPNLSNDVAITHHIRYVWLCVCVSVRTMCTAHCRH
jgi:N-acetyl-beta-hexosaminidase